MPDFQVSLEGNLAHDTLHKRRLSLAVLSHEGHLLAALDGQRGFREHRVVAIALGHLVADDGIVARTKTGRKLQSHGRVVNLVNLDGNYLLQLAQTLLHLNGFRGLIAETFHKLLDIGNFLLLVLVGTQLLFAALLAQLHILVVFHAIVCHLAA